MNTPLRTGSRTWPGQVELRTALDRQVVGAGGVRLELDAFRDACRLHAAELRQQAVAEAAHSLGEAIRNCLRVLGRAAGLGKAAAPRGTLHGTH